MNNDQAKELAEDIRSQLLREWKYLRNQAHNPANKGASYENGLRDLLSKYYGGLYEFYTEPVVIDSNLDVFDTFDTTRGQHEIDVVALFRQANPQIVFDIEEMTYVPLEGVAFICEVKNKVDKGRLEGDLEKLSKLRNLTNSDRSFGPMISGDYTTTNQLLCLVYDQSQIADETRNELLWDYKFAWDIVLIIDDDEIFINTQLPSSDIFNKTFSIHHPNLGEGTTQYTSPIISENNALMTFFLLLSISIPTPMSVSTINTMLSLRNITSNK